MTRIVVDTATLEKMGNLREPLEIFNAGGQMLGHFVPRHDPELYRRVQVPFTEEELDSFENEPGGRSLSDILRDLNKS